MSPRVAMKLHPKGECAMGSNPEGEARGMTPLHIFTQGMQFYCHPRAHMAILLSQGLKYKSQKNNLFSDKNSSNQLNFKNFVEGGNENSLGKNQLQYQFEIATV